MQRTVGGDQSGSLALSCGWHKIRPISMSASTHLNTPQVDSASAYRNEKPCGAAILKTSIPRDQLYFTSKVPPRPTLSYDATKAQVATTLIESGLSYIDLMLIHAPRGDREGRKGAWLALVEAVEEGKIRSIGISNYSIDHLNEMEEYIKELEEERGEGGGGIISVGQWEVHPWLPRQDLVDWCTPRGVIIEAYSPLTSGARLDDPLLKPLAEKHKKTPPQILLRWSLQKGFVPLPKSVTLSRIQENADLYDFELDAEDMETLTT